MRIRATQHGVPLVVLFAMLFSAGCSHKPPAYVGRVEIIGDVEMPGFYDMYEGQKAKKVVAQAGEIDEEAARYVFLYHPDEKEPYATMPLKNYQAFGHEIVLKPDDVVVFSRVAKPQVYLSAGLETAGELHWAPGMTLGHALESARVQGEGFLKVGTRVNRYGEKDVGKAGNRADKLLPGDTILLYDLFQARLPKKQWIEKAPRKQSLIVGPGDEIKAVDQPNR